MPPHLTRLPTTASPCGFCLPTAVVATVSPPVTEVPAETPPLRPPPAAERPRGGVPGQVAESDQQVDCRGMSLSFPSPSDVDSLPPPPICRRRLTPPPPPTPPRRGPTPPRRRRPSFQHQTDTTPRQKPGGSHEASGRQKTDGY